MKLINLNKVKAAAAELEDARRRKREVDNWPYQGSPNVVTVDRVNVIVNSTANRGEGRGVPYDRIKALLLTMIEEEIAVATQTLTGLGVTDV